MEISVPILAGSRFDLSLFDFSFKDIAIYDIQSEAFKHYIESAQSVQLSVDFGFVKHLIEGIHSKYEKKYALVKKDPTKDYNFQELLNAFRLLLIIFPSDLQIEHIIHYEINEQSNGSYMSTFPRRLTGDYPGESLFCAEEWVPEINEFIKKYFNSINQDNYIGLAIEHYITSFSASHNHYQYLTLCMALESIVYGNQELSYRLKRTVAILCGNKEDNSDIIFKNISKIYELRSKIIHGEKYKKEKIEEYLEPIKNIVSRTIIELLIHKIPKNNDLDNIITKIGFGDRGKISTSWKCYVLNQITFVKSNQIILQ